MLKKTLKLGITVAALSCLGLGMVAVSSLLNKNQELSVNAKDTVISEGAVTPGNAIYFNYKAGTWWTDYSAKTAFYFYAGSNNAWSGFATSVPNDSDVLEATAPALSGVSVWTAVIAVRLVSTSTSPNWNDKYYNQTVDIPINGTLNCVSLTDSSGSAASAFNYSYSTRLGYWAQSVTWWSTATICSATGGTDLSTLESSWQASATAYAVLGADVKSAFSNATAVSSATDYTGVAARYDFIYAKYGTELSSYGGNFANR
jgi:hypothetical protein